MSRRGVRAAARGAWARGPRCWARWPGWRCSRPAAAQANVVGVGNAAFGNTCASHDDARAEGATVTGSGLANGNQTGLPLSLPRNHCGNSGIICTAVFMSSV